MSEAAEVAVILRYRDGRAERCALKRPFSPRETEIEVAGDDGRSHRVALAELKAVFFPKDPRRRRVELDVGEAAEASPAGAIARVEFFDGEIIRGRVQHYSVGNSGFYLYPTAVESNNDRAFVVATALMTVDIEG